MVDDHVYDVNGWLIILRNDLMYLLAKTFPEGLAGNGIVSG